MSIRYKIATIMATLVLTTGIGSGIALVFAQSPSNTPVVEKTVTSPQNTAKGTTAPSKARKEAIQAQLATIDKELQHIGQGVDVKSYGQLMKQVERYEIELAKIESEQNSIESIRKKQALRQARINEENANNTNVPEAWINLAIERHSAMIELRKTIQEKERTMSKLPPQNDLPERAKLRAELEMLNKQSEELELKLRPEVISILRVPQIVEARNVTENILFELDAMEDRHKRVVVLLEHLRDSLRKLESHVDNYNELTERRRKLRELLFDTDLGE